VHFGRETDRVRILARRPQSRMLVAGISAVLVVTGWPADLSAQTSSGDETVVLAGREYSVAVNRERGYPTFRWSGVPVEFIHGAALSRGRGTAATSWGAGIEVRTGAPFARLGEAALPMLNSPFVSGGELWVPLELLTRVDRARPSGSVDLGLESSSAGSPEPSPVPARRRNEPWRVTIDPGHGGHDPGTVNRRTGAREKDIVLAVSKYLRDELRDRPGIEVELTRDEDRFIPLKQRPKQARTERADLFMSIHVNAEPGGGTTARGFETYYLAPTRDDESARVARLENSVLELEGEEDGFADETPVDFIVSGIVRDDNRAVSGTLGGFVQNELREVAEGPDRGTKKGPFWVLVGATGHMPAVLVELGFITNAKDERRLTDKSYQRQVASALADAVEQYFEFYDGAQTRMGGAR